MNIKIIDGGMGTYIRDKGFHICPKIWSTCYVLDHPNIVAEAHQDYVNAGCQYITTCNYSATPYYQSKKYFDIDYAISKAGEIAYQVKSNNQNKISVLGCLPPYSESYREDLVPDEQTLYSFYSKVIDLLLPYIDIFLAETLSSIREAEVIAKVCRDKKVNKIWYSFSLAHPELLRDGSSLSQLPSFIHKWGGKALLLNCTPLSILQKALPILYQNSIHQLIIGVYPNRHNKCLDCTFVLEKNMDDSQHEYLDLTPNMFRDLCDNWIEKYHIGIIGGCCGIEPKHFCLLRHK